MNQFKEISPKELTNNPFKLIGDEWTLITAGSSDSFNTMTASWGGLGVIWGKNVATIYIRPQRYTYEFLEKSDTFTLSFFTEDYKKTLGFCGKYSGRDYDKAKECSLTPTELDGSIAFEEAKLVLVCKKLYHDDINPQNFHDDTIDSINYPQHDYHRMYIGDIVKAYIK